MAATDRFKSACGKQRTVTTSFDLFGTLVDAERPADPAAAVADALADRGVRVPEDWPAAYREPHADADPGAERPLPGHVASAPSRRRTGSSNASTVASRTVGRSASTPRLASASATWPGSGRSAPGSASAWGSR